MSTEDDLDQALADAEAKPKRTLAEIRAHREEILVRALAIHKLYSKQNLTLTLRQMYYQFVARGWIASGQRSYSLIGNVLTDARYDGTFPIEGLVDRGRSVQRGDFTRCDFDVVRGASIAQDWVKALPEIMFKASRWYNQDTFVSVWVEKQALEGVFQPICDQLGVSWFACKGYPSVSALWDWLEIAAFACDNRAETESFNYGSAKAVCHERHVGKAERCVVLYFGDHDPDGWEIPRSAERNLARLARVKGIDVPIEFERIALNMDQIQQYNPPPFEAKVTSTRYRSYVNEHETDEAWELDALEPTVLRDLIKTNVERFFDRDQYAAQQDAVEQRRLRMLDIMREPSWLREALNNENDGEE